MSPWIGSAAAKARSVSFVNTAWCAGALALGSSLCIRCAHPPTYTSLPFHGATAWASLANASKSFIQAPIQQSDEEISRRSDRPARRLEPDDFQHPATSE